MWHGTHAEIYVRRSWSHVAMIVGFLHLQVEAAESLVNFCFRRVCCLSAAARPRSNNHVCPVLFHFMLEPSSKVSEHRFLEERRSSGAKLWRKPTNGHQKGQFRAERFACELPNLAWFKFGLVARGGCVRRGRDWVLIQMMALWAKMFWHPLRCLFLFLFSPRTDPCSGMMVGSIYFIVFESSTVRELLGKVFHVAEPIWCDTFHCEFGHFDAIVTLVFSSYASPIAIHEENFSKLNMVLPKKCVVF